MKQLLFFILFAISISAFSQNSIIPKGNNTILSEKERWDLNKYVWSHTNYKTGKENKPVLDFEAIENWRSLGNDDDLSVSPDGRYFSYSVKNSHLNRQADSIIVQSVQGNWRQAYAGATPGFFSADSRQYIFQSNEKLVFLQTGSGPTSSVTGIVSYQVPQNNSHEWLAYLLKDSTRSLVVKNLLTGKEKRFSGVSGFAFHKSGSLLTYQLKNENNTLLLYKLATGEQQYFPGVVDNKFDDSGQALVLKTNEKSTAGTITSLKYCQLSKKKTQTIWSTTDTAMGINSYNLDGTGRQVAFMVTDKDKHNSIWYYRAGMNRAIMKANNQTKGIDNGLTIQGLPSFTENGNYVLFTLHPPEKIITPIHDAVQVDVWNHKDEIFQSRQAYLTDDNRGFVAVVQTEGDKVIRLERECEAVKTWKIPGDFVVVGKLGKQVKGDRFWEMNYQKDSNWLVSMIDGSRRLLLTKVENYGSSDIMAFSPQGEYLVYFDPDLGYNYFSYNLNTGKVINLSPGIPEGNLCYENFFKYPKGQKHNSLNYGIAAWLEEDQRLLVYDAYDIWQLDLSGKMAPRNITNGYGRRHQIMLNLVTRGRLSGGTIPVVKGKIKTLLLYAFDIENKFNGYYRKLLDMGGDPELLYMGPFYFEITPALNGQYNLDGGMGPVKAADSDTWIVKRQSATDAPNYFVTNDFTSFTRLTDIQPQKRYNWLTAELHNFKQKDGTISQGVLYKPENFDSSRKYPVIISFYLQKSDQLYQYPIPEYLSCPAIYSNPAWFVSHGYLVFTPDIYFNTKEGWGPSTVNTMDGAANYLSTLSYVDGNHIGAAGHSNSGRFGYYLLTHSKSFAAMCIGSGTTDIIGTALSLEQSNSFHPGASMLEWAEIHAAGTGLEELWKNKAKWIDHTAVLHADKVTSPLLLVQNKGDAVLFSQPIELFTALRRLEKKVWWLQYDQGGHTLHENRDLKDLTIRYTQFFDHYLKGAPPPRWMTDGIPYKLKGVESRYELDSTGNCAKDCHLCVVREAKESKKE